MKNEIPTPIKYADARVFAPYDDSEPQYSQEIVVSFGANADARDWKPATIPIGQLVAMLAVHQVGRKDGPAFVFGEVIGGRRLKNAMKALYGVGLDIDTGLAPEIIDAKLAAMGCLALRYTTHSNGATTTEFKKDMVLQHVAKFAGNADIDDDVMRRFVREVKFWEADVAASVKVDEIVHVAAGVVVRIHHKPIAKNRVVIPFADPFVVMDEGATQKEATDKWSKIPLALARDLGIQIDRTGIDPSRLFYLPRHDKGTTKFDISIHGGTLYDWRTLNLDDGVEQIARDFGAKGKSKTDGGRALGKWAHDHAHGLLIADLIRGRAPDHLRNEVAQGVEITCPFDQGHSNAGDPDDRACLASNAGDLGELFVVKCQHESCRAYTNLDMLAAMIGHGWFDQTDIESDTYIATVIEHDVAPDDAANIDGIDDQVAGLSRKSSSADVIAVTQRALTLPKERRDFVIAEIKKKAPGFGRPIDDMVKSARATALVPVSSKTPARRELTGYALPDAAFGDFIWSEFNEQLWLFEKLESYDKRLSTPIALVGAVKYPDRNDDKARGVLLKIKAGDRDVELDLDFETALARDGAKLREILCAAGANVTKEGGAFWSAYIAERTSKLAAKVFDRPGWRGSGDGIAFLSPWGEACEMTPPGQAVSMLSRGSMLRRDGKEYDDDDDRSLDQPFTAGTLEGWKAAIKTAIETDRLQFQIGAVAGFCSPIIDLCKFKTSIVSLFGKSSSGKSSSAMLMASVWGSPAEKKGLLGNFVSSKKSPEARAESASGCGYIFDGTENDAERDFEESVYRLASDSGADTLTTSRNLNRVRSWNLLVMMTGEDSIVQSIKANGRAAKLGFSVRCLEIAMRPKEIEPDLSPETMLAITGDKDHPDGVSENWGHAWFPYVSHLMTAGYGSDPARLAREIDERVAKLVGPTAKAEVRRAAKIAGIFWRAAELAIEADLLPATFSAAKFARELWARALESEASPANAEERAVDDLLTALVTKKGGAVHESAYAGARDADAKYLDNFEGTDLRVCAVRLDRIKALAGTALEPAHLLRVLSERAVTKAVVAPVANIEQRGALLCRVKRKARGTETARVWDGVPGWGSRMRAIVILASAIEG